jgi:Xaa-Pro aminopeptidase
MAQQADSVTQSGDGAADARLIIAASEADANLFYATRFLAPDPFVYLRHGDETILLVSDLELDRARAQARVGQVLPLRIYEERAKQAGVERAGIVEALTELLRERDVRSLLVPGSFPLEHADRLRTRGLTVTAAPEPFFETRLRKSPEEIEAIRQAMGRTEAALDLAIRAIREAEERDGVLWWKEGPLTSEAVKRLIARQLLDEGLVAQHTIVACGEQACDPHQEGSGPLRPGKPIILDLFPQDGSSRYHADITRTVVKGSASEPLRRMYDAVLAAQGCALGLIRDGADGAAIHLEVQEVFRGHGYQTGEVGGRMQGFFHGTGHGLGLEVHELPRISKQKSTLRAGNVVTVEPGLYYPGVGGVRIEDVVVVTDTGHRNLASYPKLLEV